MDNEISRYLKVFEWVRCPEVEDIDGRKIIYLSRGYFKDTNKRLIYLGEDLFPVAKYDQMKNRYWSSQKLRSFLDFDPKEGFKKIHLEKSLKPKKTEECTKEEYLDFLRENYNKHKEIRKLINYLEFKDIENISESFLEMFGEKSEFLIPYFERRSLTSKV